MSDDEEMPMPEVNVDFAATELYAAIAPEAAAASKYNVPTSARFDAMHSDETNPLLALEEQQEDYERIAGAFFTGAAVAFAVVFLGGMIVYFVIIKKK